MSFKVKSVQKNRSVRLSTLSKIQEASKEEPSTVQLSSRDPKFYNQIPIIKISRAGSMNPSPSMRTSNKSKIKGVLKA